MPRPHLRTGLRGTLLLATIVPLALVAVVAIAAIQAFTRSLEEADATARSDRVVHTANLVIQDVIDAETGMRGYVIVRQTPFLDPYVRGTRDFATHTAELETLLAGRPAQLEQVHDVERTFDEWRSEIAEPVIAAIAAGAFEDASALLLAGAGKARTDRIRATLENLTTTERTGTEARAAATRADALGARRIAFWGTLLVILIGIGVAIAFTRRVARRVGTVAAAASRIAGGDLAARVPVTGADELTDLATAFNGMADRLEASFVGERQAVADLRRRTAEVEQANRELETFSYSVSHDLRAPLRSIDGFSQALLDDYSGVLDETGRGFLGRVRAATQRMGLLIDDLLRLSRMSRETMRPEPIDLSGMAAEIAGELQLADPGRSVKLEIEPEIRVVGDRRLLRVAMENLLCNAWKFTRGTPGARIDVREESGADGVEYVVSDNGAGFDMRFADKLFGPYQRLHGSEQFEGTGIGLATVQRIVHRHSGTITAVSELGRGATFRFTLHASADGQFAPGIGGLGTNG